MVTKQEFPLCRQEAPLMHPRRDAVGKTLGLVGRPRTDQARRSISDRVYPELLWKPRLVEAS